MRTRAPLRALWAAAALATTAAALAGAQSAGAAPAVNGVYDVSGSPGYITTGPDGNLWTTLTGSSDAKTLARITPAGTVTEFAPAKAGANPVGITAGPDGNLWLTKANGVVRVPSGDPESAEDFTIAALTDPRDITAGPDGNLWAASGDQLLKIPPADPTGFEAFTIAGMGARGIDSGGGRLWIADFGSARAISATTAGVATPVDVGGGPQEVAAGPGDQAAFTNPGANPQTIGRLTPAGTPLLTQTPLADPFGIDFGADGAYWIAQFAAGNLGRLTPAGGYTTLGGLPAGSGPRQLTAGPGNTIWVSLETAQKVARVTGVDPPDPPDPPTPPDRRAPELSLKYKALQPSSRRIVVRAKVDEAADVVLRQRGRKATVTGERAGASGKRRLRLRTVERSLSADEGKRLKLAVQGRRAKRTVRKLLGNGKRIRFALRAAATDAAGNRAAIRFAVTLRKRR